MALPVYRLPDGGTERRRYDELHRLVTECNGYVLHPALLYLVHELEDARIAEFGTGTGVWMRDLEEQPDIGNNLYDGFDISAALWPNNAPINHKFHLLDVREECPYIWQREMDIIHIRFIAGGMRRDDWTSVVECAFNMLGYGHALMWTEIRLKDFEPAVRPRRSATDNGLSKLINRYLNILSGRLEGAEPTEEVRKALTGEEWEEKEVLVDVKSSDERPELRERFSIAMAHAAEATVRKEAELNVTGAWSLEELQTIREAAAADIRSGTYSKFDIYTFVAWREGGDRWKDRNPKKDKGWRLL